MGIHIGCDHSRGMDLLRAVLENFQGVDIQMFRVICTLEALELLQAFLSLPVGCNHIAAVNINGQLSLLIQLAQALINPLMERGETRNTGVKDTRHTGAYRKINLSSRVFLSLHQVKRQVSFPDSVA